MLILGCRRSYMYDTPRGADKLSYRGLYIVSFIQNMYYVYALLLLFYRVDMFLYDYGRESYSQSKHATQPQPASPRKN